MIYPVKEHLLLRIQHKLICTVTYALIVYDIAWKLHENRHIPMEKAVDLIIQSNR